MKREVYAHSIGNTIFLINENNELIIQSIHGGIISGQLNLREPTEIKVQNIIDSLERIKEYINKT